MSIAPRRQGALAGMLGLLCLAVCASVAAAAPSRVIALGSDVTEIVHALGEEGRLVARDATSQYPESVRALPDVGYLRQLGAEGVLSLRPDLILAAPDAGPREALEQMRSTGVTVADMPKGHGADALIARVKQIADVLGVPEKGEALAAKLRTEIAAAEAEVAKMQGRPKVLFIIAAAGGSPQAAGRHTAADTMIALAGGENVFAAHEGYKAVSLETTAAAGPDAIAMMTHTLANMGGLDGVTKHPALRLTPAAKTRRIVTDDGGYMLGFGPRLPQAILDFARAIRGGGKS